MVEESKIAIRQAARSPWFWVPVALFPIASYVPLYLARHEYHVPVGIYIGIMGLLAAAVTLRDKPSIWEKAVWILILTCMMAAEIRNLYVADAEQAKKFDTIQQRLDATKAGLDKTVIGLSSAADSLKGISGEITGAAKQSQVQFNGTMSQMRKAVDTETGGNSFCYLMSLVPTESEVEPILLMVGNYSLYDVGVRVTDAKFVRSSKNVFQSDILSTKIGDLSPPGSAHNIGTLMKYKIPGDYQELNIFFSAKNGWWTQLWRLQKVNGQWEEAIIVVGTLDRRRYPKGAILKRYVTKGYPVQKLAADEDWRNQEKANLPQAAY